VEDNELICMSSSVPVPSLVDFREDKSKETCLIHQLELAINSLTRNNRIAEV